MSLNRSVFWGTLVSLLSLTSLAAEPQAEPSAVKQAVFVDKTFVISGKSRLYQDWDFVTGIKTEPGCAKNWLTPVNYAEGNLRFRLEVLEMGPVDKPMSIGMGWWNTPKDPEIRHTAGAMIKFDKPGVYETVVPINKIEAYYGAGPKRDKLCREWHWDSAYADNSYYVFVRPNGNPKEKQGFPIKVHATVTIMAKE
jgi:hypothetical protein